MIVVEWNVTRLCTKNYVIRFWIYDEKEGSYYWKNWKIKSIHKLRDPKRLFLKHPKYPFLSSYLSYTKDYREFEVTKEELEKGFLGIDL